MFSLLKYNLQFGYENLCSMYKMIISLGRGNLSIETISVIVYLLKELPGG